MRYKCLFMPLTQLNPSGFAILEATIPSDLAGQRLDKALALLLAGKTPVLSRVRLQALDRRRGW